MSVPENPRALPDDNYEDRSYVQLYKPLDPRMNKFRVNENFVSLVHLLDETLFDSSSLSEGEIETGEKEIYKSKQAELQQNPMKLDDTETLASLHALIAEVKNKHNLKENKENKKKSEIKAKEKTKEEEHNKVLEKLSTSDSSRNKKCDPSSSTRQDSFISCRSASQSSSSSTETPLKYHKSTSLDKSSICLTSPKRPPSKQYVIPQRRQLVDYQGSSSSSPSPGRSSSHNKSSTSRRHTDTHKSSKRHTTRNRSSSTGSRYSRPSKSSIRSSSRSPTRSTSSYKSSKYDTSSKRHSSPYRRSSSNKQYPSSHRLSPSRSPSPARSSSRYKSYEKSSKLFTSVSHRSPMREQSLSPHRSPSHYTSSCHSKRSSNCPKSPSPDKRSKRSKSRSNRSPVRQRKISTEDDDDYTELLVEEMKKRQIYKGSDSKVEPQVVEQNKAVLIEEKEIPENKEPKDLSQDEQNLVEKESEIVNQKVLQVEPTVPQSKNVKEETKSEFNDKKEYFSNIFYCPSCQLSLNSESTWQSHINGKKHAKVLKLQTVHEVAKGSIAIPSNPAFALQDVPRFANPPAGLKHFRIRDVPRLQPAIDNCTKCPILGLDFLNEIRAEKEVHYYCEMCDAPCSAHSIMPHLTGHKHQLCFLKKIDLECYEKNKSLSKKQFDLRLSAILYDHQCRFGRGEIKVFEEREDLRATLTHGMLSKPGPSWGNVSPIKKERDIQGASDIPLNDECLDVSKAVFYCKICDAHMNSINMWEAHMRGKRHLTNAKKIPGENISKVRSVKAPPNVRSKLEHLVHEKAANEIIVGLDFIRETQGPNGELYNCFLCGSCCTNFDIINHLLLTKHRIRYLEKLSADGKTNGITIISQMDMQDDYFRKNLIDDECLRMVEEYGCGNVEVYVLKK